MKFRKEPVQSCYLLDTGVENIFIHEYMVSAPGDYVKIYLVALMYTNMGQDIENASIAKMLSLPDEEVEKAWMYWEGLGVVRKTDDTMEFSVLKEYLYGKKTVKDVETRKAKPSAILENKPLKGMYQSIERTIGRMLSGVETTEMINWMDDYGATPELIAYAYAYCMTKKKDNVRYVGAVVKGWTAIGLTNSTEIEKYLAENDQRHYAYKRIMQALGFSRNATEEEKRLINNWFDGLGCDMEDILSACGKTSGIPNPNINYVNKILANRHGGIAAPGGQSPAVTVSAYYQYLREKAIAEANQRRDEVYNKIPDMDKLEESMRQCSVGLSRVMVSGGIDKEDQINNLKQEMDRLTRKKANMLTEHNLPSDYMDVKYTCSLCKDTGTKDSGEQCECFLQRTKEMKEKEWERTS
jgi:DnaD/phage-associated family protein